LLASPRWSGTGRDRPDPRPLLGGLRAGRPPVPRGSARRVLPEIGAYPGRWPAVM